MRLNSFFYILLNLLIFSSTGFADNYLLDKKIEYANLIQSSVFNDNFIEASSRADSLIALYPDDPIGYLFKSAVYLAEMTDAEENLYPVEFHKLIDTVIVLTDSKKADSNFFAWMSLWKGHAHAYRSLWESRFGSFSSALKHGFKAKSCYEEGLEHDSTLYDLYGGIGMYHYWKSAKTGMLRWLGIFKNEKQKGIDELYLTIDSSLLSRYSARNALVWIYFDKKEYDSVIAICNELLKQFPDGKIFLWPLAEAFNKNKDYKSAINIYNSVREKLIVNPGNYYNLIECDFKLLRSLEKLNNKKEAHEFAVKFLDYYEKIPKDISWRQRNKVSYLKRASK